ncbi:Os05g0144225 [Oryza sativa Japonica Group]|uniref:Os05g0144225 protein n=1 Tax=Oryza sativa subsp. japonica TaxID=39947 RepID=A0A0P0WI52_ORYSJ|nr:Os05g0144225 [Oryza sativa Japonica Group]
MLHLELRQRRCKRASPLSLQWPRPMENFFSAFFLTASENLGGGDIEMPLKLAMLGSSGVSAAAAVDWWLLNLLGKPAHGRES